MMSARTVASSNTVHLVHETVAPILWTMEHVREDPTTIWMEGDAFRAIVTLVGNMEGHENCGWDDS